MSTWETDSRSGPAESVGLRSLANRLVFPPLEILPATPDDSGVIWRRLGVRPDAVFTVVWSTQRHSFVVEQKGSSTPRELETAIRQALRYADLSRGQYLPMVVLPYLNPEALERLVATQTSGIDLSGNGVVVVPGRLLVYRTGEKNKFPANTPIRNVYRGTTSLVSRVFFARGSFSSVTEVREEIEHRGGRISLSTVSKALRALQEDLVVGREQGVRLLQPEKLLDLLVRNYRGPEIQRRVSGRLQTLPSTLRKLAENARALGLPVAADLPSRYVVMPSSEETIAIYTPSIDELLGDVALQETTRFPNVILLETRDQTIYFDRREEDGFFWLSPLGTYLELSTGGKREREAARQVRDDLLGFDRRG